MSRKLVSLAMLAAAFTLVLGTTEAQACRRNRNCCQNSNYGYGQCGQQQANYGCQQSTNCGFQQQSHYGHQQVSNRGQQSNCGIRQANCNTTSTCCNPRPTCCGAQPACSASVIPASFVAPQPPVEYAPGSIQGN